MASYVNLLPGDPAPWFKQRSASNEQFSFDTTAGRYIVMCFLASAGDPTSRSAYQAALARRDIFDDRKASLFAVSVDRADESEKRIVETIPGYRVFWDFDGLVCKRYGALPTDTAAGQEQVKVRRFWVVLDPMLRVMKVFPFSQAGGDASQVLDYVASLPEPSLFAGAEMFAPVLMLPNVFEPEFCAKLVELYQSDGGAASGFMREVGGKTVMAFDKGHKSRKDHLIKDQEIIRQTQARMIRRVVPEIAKVHQFKVTRMERYIVSCYADEEGGHFRPHRDNTTKGTAHRRFAVSINLNADFEGGEIGFPEYGTRSYKPSVGGACVFSCSLLHTVSTVRKGRRYAFLPFLYDDEAARLRESNNAFLAEGVGQYRIDQPN